MAEPIIPSKTCTRCKAIKPVTEFYKQGLGFSTRCAPCLRDVTKRQRAGEPVSRPRDRTRFDTERNMLVRLCAHCQIEKPLTEFHHMTGHLFKTECKQCALPKHRARYHQNPEKAREITKRCHRKHAEARRTYARNRLAKMTFEQRQEITRLFHERYPNYTREYYASHKDQTRQSVRDWRSRNPDRAYEQQARRRARLVGATSEPIDREVIVLRDNSTCYLCGRILTLDEITIDHVMPLARGGSHTMDNLRVACGPCNSAKRMYTLDEYRAHLRKRGQIIHDDTL